MAFFSLISIAIRSQMQYPLSFLMLFLGHFLGTCIDFFGLWVLFDRFQLIEEWSLYEVGLLYGIVQMGFSFADGFGRGFDHFGLILRKGDFDRMLLRPISPLLQVAAYEIQWMRMGRFFQGLIVFWISALHLTISINPLILLFSILSTASLFYALFIFEAALAFWTLETLEWLNIATFGGLETGQYPLSIFPKSFRWLFTFLIPLACVVYYPVLSLLGKSTLPVWIGLLSPFAGFCFLLIAILFWKRGCRRYCSTGS